MKHFTLLLSAALMSAMSAMAATPMVKGGVQKPNQISRTQKTVKKSPSRAIDVKARQLDLSRLVPAQKAPSRAADMPIYSAEGEVTEYMVDTEGWINTLFDTYVGPGLSFKDVVWGEDGDVYIKNFVNIGVDTYVKGKYADKKITIDLPQVVFYEPGDEEYEEQVLSLTLMEYSDDAEYYYQNVADNTQVVLQEGEDGTFSFDLCPEYSYEMFEEEFEFPPVIVGLCGDTSAGASDWYPYGDYRQSYSKSPWKSIVPPEDAEIDTWVMTFTNDAESTEKMAVDVAIYGNEFYLGGFDEDVEGWIKGIEIGGKVFFKGGQYLSYNSMYQLPFFMLTGTYKEVYFEEYDEYGLDVDFTNGITFDYDKAAKKLTCTDEDMAMVLNGDPEELYYLNIFINPEIRKQSAEECNAAPADPEFGAYQAWDPDFYGGQGSIIWFIPDYNVNGALLDTEKMYYHFIVDDEVYAIDPEEYPFVEEYMVDIPYDYYDGMDIWAMGEEHDIYFYFDGAESFGIQSFYVGDNGVTYASNIVTYYPERDEVVTGVKSVESTSATSKYYDINGREIANPGKGLYIKAVKNSDGTISASKVFVK